MVRVTEEELTKESAKKLMSISGEARGIHLRNDAEYILSKKGQKGLDMVEKELARLGYPIKYAEVKNMGFHPAGLRLLSLLTTKKVFNWEDRDIRDMCSFAAGASFVVKFYIKFFYSIPKVLEKASKMWREYWTEGELSVKEYSEEERRAVISIKNFDLHPTYCRCLEGYMSGLTRMVAKSEKAECIETKCAFKGGEGHEFEIRY